VIARQMKYYNQRRRHSTLNYTAPMRYIIQEEILPQSALGLATLGT
jgi:transposase InsO family protein